MNRPTTFVEAEANFIADFPGWASRTTQQAFALAVEEALASNQHLLAQAGCGCIQGDAEIIVNRGGNGNRYPLSEVVAKFNGAMISAGPRLRSYGWDLDIPTYIQREVDGEVRLVRLVNAWCSGVKTTYTVTTETGRTLRATDEHPFLTERGWLRLDQLIPGDLVHVRGPQKGAGRQHKPFYVRVLGMCHHPYANRWARPNGRFKFMVPEHRLVAEASRNGLGYTEFLARVRGGDVEGLSFLDSAVWTVHHEDHNPRNNDLGNLKVLTHREHHQLHAEEGTTTNVLYKVVTEKVVSVELYGEEETYDLEVEGEPHNFLANGFVVHNTGKSFGVLVPVILDGRRAVVSTATKQLQNQYVEKDLPWLQAHLGVRFTYAMLKGRSNYLCTNRAGLVVAEDEMVPRLIELTKVPGFTGLREEVPFEVPNWLWTKVCGNTDECDEIGCKDMGGCYVLLAREVASMAQVVVVNHSLLALDGASGHGLLGEYDVVVVDELHELAEYAIGAFETNFSELSVRSMQAEVRNFVNAIYGGDEKLDEVSESLSGANALFWMALTAQMPPRVDQLAITTEVITKAGDEWVTLANTLHEYAAAISALTTPIGTVEAKRFRILRKKARIMAAKFSDLINNPFDTWVRWIEWQTNYVRNTRRLAIKAQPVEVGPFLQEFLFANCTVIGVSATVAPGGKFEFMAGQLGLAADQYRGVDVGTNFDYQHQALTYVPTIAAPSNEPGNDWERALPIQIKALLDASQGRALVLFTSIKQLNNVYDAISDIVPWTCYKQGQFNQGELMRRFSTEIGSVLFATKSWFTGVDIQGESLSMVILDRIPFKNPKDPVVAATSALYDRRYPPSGSFAHYTLPSAQMTLSQAYGRLIRTVTDRGVFACLDSRLLKTWGAGIARQLPPAPRTSNIDDVTGFFA